MVSQLLGGAGIVIVLLSMLFSLGVAWLAYLFLRPKDDNMAFWTATASS